MMNPPVMKHLQPYLFFNGRCEEAIAFYQKVLGAEIVMLSRFGEAPADAAAQCPSGREQKVMHASLRLGDRELLVSDGMVDAPAPEFAGFGLSIEAGSVEEGGKLLAALANDGGRVVMPFAATFWSEGFGMAHDKFGVLWMVGVAH